MSTPLRDAARISSPDATSELLDAVVIGAGPAGLTAALYLRRFHRHVRIVDAGDSRASYIGTSHNLAGFPQGITGTQLLERMTRHLGVVGGFVVHDAVASVEQRSDETFALGLTHETLFSRTVIVCTGVKDRPVRLTGAKEVAAAGLLRACPVCDGYEFTGKRIGVIGTSLHGVREAAFLRTFSGDVWFINLSDDSTDPAMDVEIAAAGLRRTPGVARHLALGRDHTVFVTTDDGAGHSFDIVYAALGVDPRTDLLASLGAELGEAGCAVTDAHCRTSVKNVFAAGDAVSGLHQIAVAVGQGAIAATAVHNDLRLRSD